MKTFLNISWLPAALLGLVFLVCSAATCNRTGHAADGGNKINSESVEWWLTKGDGSVLFQQQQALSLTPAAESALPTITIDGAQVFQTMDGFGFTLTGGSAEHLLGMGATERAALLRELFHFDGTNIGISYLRVSIGASDLNSSVFSYNDLPAGQTDPQIMRFDFGPDKTTVLPVLKEILAINPAIKIMGSPWSPPAWMKTNGDTRAAA